MKKVAEYFGTIRVTTLFQFKSVYLQVTNTIYITYIQTLPSNPSEHPFDYCLLDSTGISWQERGYTLDLKQL